MIFSITNKVTKIPVLQVALANINFVDVLSFKKVLKAALKLSDDGTMSLRPIVKKAFESIPKARVLIKIMFQRKSIGIVADNHHISIVEAQFSEVPENEVNPKSPHRHTKNEHGEKRQEIISGDKISLSGYDVCGDKKYVI